MNFEVLPISDIWLDFTRSSPIEEAICTVENILAKWSKGQVWSLEKSRFGFQSIYYFLNYVPRNYSQSSTIKDQFISYPSNAIDLLRSIFGIDSSFVYVTNGDEKDKIDKKVANNLLSIIRPAAQATKFKVPILMKITSNKGIAFVGFKLDENTETFYSGEESQDSKTFESLQVIQNMYKDQISLLFKAKEINDLTTSYRVNLKFKEDSLVGKENAHYQSAKFYSFMPNDPVQRFCVTCDFNDIDKNQTNKNENDCFNIMNATSMCISIKRIDSVYIKSNTSFFIGNMEKCKSHKSWKPILPKVPNTLAKSMVTELFSKFEKNDSKNLENTNYLTDKTILKASPANSLLNGVIELLLNTSELPIFASIWVEFIKELRRRTDHHEYIPGVGRNGPDLDHCLYYQKLEMLNLCIKCMIIKNKDSNDTNKTAEKANNANKNTKLLLDGTPMVFPETQEAPVRTEDQILESVQLLEKNMDDQRQKAILQSGQLKSDMAAFKRANPTAEFEDFVHWYSPADYDPQSKKLSSRMSTEDNVWKELWVSARTGMVEKSLFDPVAQSEYVLDFFESLAPGEVFGDLIPVVFATIYYDVLESTKNISTIYAVKKSLRVIEEQINIFHTEVEKIEGTLPLESYMSLSLNIFKIIEEAMLTIHCANSLMLKFNNNIVIVNQLLENGYHFIVNNDERDLLNTFLKNVGIDTKNGKSSYLMLIHDESYIMNGFIENEGKKLQQRFFVFNSKKTNVTASTMQEKI